MLVALTFLIGFGLPAVVAPAAVSEVVSAALAGQRYGQFVLGGSLAGVILWLLLRSRPSWRFLDTLQHEGAHLIAAYVLGARPNRLAVAQEHGNVQFNVRGFAQNGRVFLVAIAPYCFSPLWLLVLLLSLVTTSAGLGLFVEALAFGVALAFPLLQIHPRQTDLSRHGFFLPVAAALWMWLATLVLTLSALRVSGLRALWWPYRDAAQQLLRWVESALG